MPEGIVCPVTHRQKQGQSTEPPLGAARFPQQRGHHALFGKFWGLQLQVLRPEGPEDGEMQIVPEVILAQLAPQVALRPVAAKPPPSAPTIKPSPEYCSADSGALGQPGHNLLACADPASL